MRGVVLAKIGMTMLLLLCCALPASASDYTLEIFGNANEDETINMQDVTYTELIILEYRDKTDLADGKYDGKINMQDVTQIELVILSREKELTVIDREGEAVTIPKPINRIVTEHWSIDESMRILGAADLIVGVNEKTTERPFYFPKLSKLPSIGMRPVDYEAILSLHPDVFIRRYGIRDAAEKLPGITVFSLKMSHPGGIYDYPVGQEPPWTMRLRELGYILDKREEADEYIDWYGGVEAKIRERTTDGLTEDEKLLAAVSWEVSSSPGSNFEITVSAGPAQAVRMAGVRLAGEDLETRGSATVDTEWMIRQNPDIMVTSQVGPPHCGYETDDTSEMIAVRDSILNRPDLATINAVKNKHVYVQCAGIFDYSPAHIVGATYFAKLFYPGLFEDVDSRAIHQEYLEFQGLDFIDVHEHGVFIYPRPEEN